MDLELEGKTALVTGGSRGIGKAIARVLASEGVDVAIAARTRETLDQAAREIEQATGRKVVPVIGDTSDSMSVATMAAEATAALGRIDILVNNAARPGGGGPVHGLQGIEDEAFHEDMNTKVLGYIRCARAVAPGMKERGWGRIINISGLAARQSGNPIGSMRNVAVAALTKNLADELGPSGINVTVVHPGLTWTERLPELLEAQASRTGNTPDEVRERMAANNAVRRIIDADDIANIVAFLASPKSIAITGDAIPAGGGLGQAIYY